MGGDASLYIYEPGVYRGQFGTYASTDQLRVAVENGAVKYYRNGVLLYTSTVAPQYPLLVDTSLNTVNSQISNVVISGAPVPQNVTWTSVASTIQVSGNSLLKVSGAPSWYDAGAVSTQSIASGNGYVEFTAGNATTWRMCGLGNGDSSYYYDDIEFAFYTGGGGDLHIYEAGVYRGQFGSYTGTDQLRVAVENGAVKYYRNGVLLYTSTVAPQYPLLVDTSLNTVNSQISNVVISGASGSGGGSSAGTWTRGYVYLGGQLLAIQFNSSVTWVHQEPFSKGQRLTDAGGNIVSTVEVDPWGGETTWSSNSLLQPHKYTSYERDSDGGDYAMNRRYGSIGARFSQADPYDGSYNMNDPQSFNRYSYVQNDPVNFTDPSGLVPSDGCGADLSFAQCYGNSQWDPFFGGSYGWNDGWGHDPNPGGRVISGATANHDQRVQNTIDQNLAQGYLNNGNFSAAQRIFANNSNVGLSVAGLSFWGTSANDVINTYQSLLPYAEIASSGLGDFKEMLKLEGFLLDLAVDAAFMVLKKTRQPDFFVVSAGVGIGKYGIGSDRAIVSGDGWDALINPMVGSSIGTGGGVSAAFGWLWQLEQPRRRDIENFLGGVSGQISYFEYLGAGWMMSPNSPTKYAFIAGYGAGGKGGSAGFSTRR